MYLHLLLSMGTLIAANRVKHCDTLGTRRLKESQKPLSNAGCFFSFDMMTHVSFHGDEGMPHQCGSVNDWDVQKLLGDGVNAGKASHSVQLALDWLRRST